MSELINKPEKVSEDHYLLKIKTGSASSYPGQFINIKTTESTDPLIRRPFSIYSHKKDIIEIIIRVIGKGTEILKNSTPGGLDVLGPLGNGFSLVENKNVLLVGGGVGNAPLYYLGEMLRNLGNKMTYIYGARSKKYIYLEREYKRIFKNLLVSTDDGSEGKKGFVTDIAEKIIASENIDMIYTCGPTVMMKKISEISGKIPVEVSVENYFGCGIGLCVGCSLETTDGPRRACIDGPVFDGKKIVWDSLL